MKRIFFSILLLLTAATAAAVELNREGRDASYVETILKRSQKIVDGLGPVSYTHLRAHETG